jgi:hypothetical protein
VVAGHEPDDHNAAWTRAQVERRRDVDVAGLVAEWRGVAPAVREYLRTNPRPVVDLTVHEQDLRGALGVPGGRDTAAAAFVRDRFLHRVAPALGDLPPLALVGEPGLRWCSRGAPEDAAVVLAAPAFELGRALVARRSAAQLRSWTVRGDVTPYLPAFATVGDLPARDLSE